MPEKSTSAYLKCFRGGCSAAKPVERRRRAPLSLESRSVLFSDHEEPHLLSRIRILALFATLAALASVFAACGGGGDSSSEDPQKVVENASLEGVKSGEFEMSLNVNAEGEEGGEFDVSLSGPFEAGAKGELPQAEVSVEAKGSAQGEDIDFDGA